MVMTGGETEHNRITLKGLWPFELMNSCIYVIPYSKKQPKRLTKIRIIKSNKNQFKTGQVKQRRKDFRKLDAVLRFIPRTRAISLDLLSRGEPHVWLETF